VYEVEPVSDALYVYAFKLLTSVSNELEAVNNIFILLASELEVAVCVVREVYDKGSTDVPLRDNDPVMETEPVI